jgi:hypothetical protein
LEYKKSSSEFELLKNESEEAYDYFREELEQIKLSLPSKKDQHSYSPVQFDI